MRELGESLHAAGHSVAGVRVAGHGTSVADLARTSWRDWMASARQGLAELGQRCDTTVVIGLSMGSLLALALAHEQPEQVGGIALLSTALVVSDRRLERYLPLLRATALLGPALPRPWRTLRKGGRDIADPAARADSPAYDAVPLRSLVHLIRLQRHARRCVPAIRQPVLAIHAREDHTCPLDNVALLQRRLPAPPEVKLLARSYHVVTVDYEKREVADEVAAFVARVAAGESGRDREDELAPAVAPLAAAGLCAQCRHVRWVQTRSSTFALCRRAEQDPAFPRYPRLPVLGCPGHEPAPAPTAQRR